MNKVVEDMKDRVNSLDYNATEGGCVVEVFLEVSKEDRVCDFVQYVEDIATLDFKSSTPINIESKWTVFDDEDVSDGKLELVGRFIVGDEFTRGVKFEDNVWSGAAFSDENLCDCIDGGNIDLSSNIVEFTTQ